MITKENQLVPQEQNKITKDYLLLDNVTKKFGTTVAVDHLTISVAKGEFIALLGPSGCGKTTTLRLIAGLEKPTEGKIFLDGQDITNVHPRERDVAMVFQDYALYPHMTLFENIAYPLKLRKVPRKTIEEKVLEVATRLGIKDLLSRRPGQVSGGQQQRAAVARALVYRPKIFLFDEPLSNLDAKLRLEARAFLQHLCKEEKITTIYVTHDQAEAMAMADRIGVMDQGKLLQIGTPFEIYHRPNNIFVAGFIGNPPMNLLTCFLKQEKDLTIIVGNEFELDLTLPLEQKFSFEKLGEKYLMLGFRPEHVKLSSEPGPYAIPGHLYAIQPLGAETLITLQVGTSLVSVRLFTDQPPTFSNQMYIHLNPNRIYIFAETGERLWP
ncbi:ABC transporter ATP-binding protein [Pseudothermotoga thermarum]|uniref:ABC transporter related protein n=1 Tax=Pseudothermotoga thermarum DSM 5069 TaxID=688269 RepID=F7YUX1_9THEM|nr:ABC transporter ATP-binding protein [Pseudothermotoga thermarum]AEH51532.1 ABC transporter related protein [Pseudothermotoga thermarum DSM 5069]